jgi:hypothetical protein
LGARARLGPIWRRAVIGCSINWPNERHFQSGEEAANQIDLFGLGFGNRL